MPQLDTSTWLITVVSSSVALFSIMQLKINFQTFPKSISTNKINFSNSNKPWNLKWTKICLPLSLPLR